MESPFTGMDMAASPHPALRQVPPAGPPPVRIEVRNGTSRPITFDISGEEFLIGSVPGCDLRLPGTNLPPVVCLIARQADGVRLRKLAPTLPILVNGQPISHSSPTNLVHGDCISVGAIDIIVSIEFAVGAAPLPKAAQTPADDAASFVRRERELLERERQLEEQTRELEADRILWYRRRDEIERETRQAQTAGGHPAHDDPRARDHRLLREAGLEAELSARRLAFEDELREQRRKAEEEMRQWREQNSGNIAALRAQIEAEAQAKIRQRTEELDRYHLSLREAAVQLRELKQKIDDEIRQYEPARQELAEREAALKRRAEELEQQLAGIGSERGAHDREMRGREEHLRRREDELNERAAQIRKQQTEIDVGRELVEKGKKQYESDLIRLDRWQSTLDEKEKELAERAKQIDERFERFRSDGSDLEEHALQIDAREEQLRAEEERLARQRETIEAREKQANERLAKLEGQQAMLAALRTRLEHIREEQRAEAARIADERGRLDDLQRESRERLQEAERLREQLSLEQMGQSEAEKHFHERSEMLHLAVERVRELQQKIATDDQRLRQADADLLVKAAAMSEREGMLQAKTDQLLEAQRRLDADRLALKQREESIVLTEGTRESLQDQLRRRAEELTNRQRDLDARAARIDEQARQIAEQQASIDQLRTAAESHAAELARRDEDLRLQADRLRQAEQTVVEQRKQLEEAHAQWNQERQSAATTDNQARAEIDELKQALAREASELFRQVPDMESRAQAALERTTQARESLRAQLAELHSYAKQSQEDLDKVRGQVQGEIERLRQQETELNRARAEHRHAVASFRQQLVEWQSRFSGMKQALSQGESRVERREKDVETTQQQLARQAEELQAKEREVVERRDEMHRHLNDMREWYRKKLRELVQSRNAERAARMTDDSEEPDIIPLSSMRQASASAESQSEIRNPKSEIILSIQDELDPADRKLGELLQSLELVDPDTLIALWNEARRQHRPLRQVLLAGNYLTLYQLALIESGNLGGLVLGRFRVIDRLQSTPREAIYRVFDPNLEVASTLRGEALARHGVPSLQMGNCLLRHLGEMEMSDAVRPDEYRQRFGAARDLAHPNIAATLEVLEINRRPAVVQEWLSGLSGSDFPAAAGAPAVWCRLLAQAAFGMHAAHQAGLIHGRLTADSLVLTREGVLKITGLGEPPWLHSPQQRGEATAEDDLRALGQIVFGWSQLAPKRKGKKGLPEGLLGLLRGLGVETDGAAAATLYPSMAALLDEIDRVADQVPPDGPSWQKLLQHVAENSGDAPLLRQSA